MALADETEARAADGFDKPMLLVIDDADALFDNNAISAALNTLVLNGRDAGVIVAMAASTFRTSTAYETWIRAMRAAGHGLVLQPDGDKDEDISRHPISSINRREIPGWPGLPGCPIRG